MSWYRELPHSQRLLMVAIHKRVTVTELAVLTILVNQADRMGVRSMSSLWNGCLLEYRDRLASSDYPLHYTKQGIWKAVNALVDRGWVEKVHGLYGRNDPELRVLPLNILSEAPAWLRPGEAADGRREAAATPVDPTAGSATSSAGKRRRTSTPVDAELVVNVQVENDARGYYVCRETDGRAPKVFYRKLEHSMPSAAREYASKVASRLLERTVGISDLAPSHEGKGRYSYTLREKGGKRAR